MLHMAGYTIPLPVNASDRKLSTTLAISIETESIR